MSWKMPSLQAMWDWWFTPLGLILASMFAGEYLKPAAIISRFIDDVRGRF